MTEQISQARFSRGERGHFVAICSQSWSDRTVQNCFLRAHRHAPSPFLYSLLRWLTQRSNSSHAPANSWLHLEKRYEIEDVTLREIYLRLVEVYHCRWPLAIFKDYFSYCKSLRGRCHWKRSNGLRWFLEWRHAPWLRCFRVSLPQSLEICPVVNPVRPLQAVDNTEHPTWFAGWKSRQFHTVRSHGRRKLTSESFHVTL